MNNGIEQDLPFTTMIASFAVLMLVGTMVKKSLRAKARLQQGQVASATGRSAPIEERIAFNRAWASGRIRSNEGKAVVILWLLALVWSLTFGVSFIKSLSNPEMQTGARTVLGVFAALGIVPLYFALRATARRFRFGPSWCCIDGKAGVLGRKMTGVVHTSTDIQPTGDYKISLQCLEFYTRGSGKERRAECRSHFTRTEIVSPGAVSAPRAIPFAFELPSEVPETGCEIGSVRVQWQLRLDVPSKGVDYSALFVVPVFNMD